MVYEVFERERQRLLSIAYGFLGSLSEAEDVLQEAYLRLERTDLGAIREPAAWLTTVVSRLALDELRSARRRRETYVGEWLPEPVFEAPLAEQLQITRSRLSLAFLHLMERLEPEQRAVLVLREVFEYSYREIAETLGKSEAACRQIRTRARARLDAEDPAVEAAPGQVEPFIAALNDGDEQALLSLLAPDAVFYGDGGGKTPSVLNPVFGAEKVARFFLGLGRKFPGRFSSGPASVNGAPGVLTFSHGELSSVTALAWEDGRIVRLYSVLNPDKLRPASRRALSLPSTS